MHRPLFNRRLFKRPVVIISTLLFLLGGGGSTALADELPVFKLVVEQHRFVPENIEVPAGKKVRLIVENRDASAEEFESYDLNREKVVAAKSSIVVFIGPLKAGRYEFFGDFHPQSARGFIVAK